jgi:hypothetical protein
MATKGIKRRQKKSAVEAVGPPLAWGAYYKGLAAQQSLINIISIDLSRVKYSVGSLSTWLADSQHVTESGFR